MPDTARQDIAAIDPQARAVDEGHDARELMDGIYRRQRLIYDLTRKYYLLGRDRLIRQLDVPHGGSVLELGCGTGRNLIKTARLYRDSQCHGLDLSIEMLRTANRSVARRGLSGRIVLAQGDATAFDPAALFGKAKFDRVFVSYSLSMIPQWEAVLDAGMTVLAPGGSLHVVDFGQQTGLPRWFRSLLHGWLAKFHVTPRPDLEQAMERAALAHGGRAQFSSIQRDYARIGAITIA
jgi:S-adenosylmethionine-diacylgycerolhomoserine-N-methlytransferase